MSNNKKTITFLLVFFFILGILFYGLHFAKVCEQDSMGDEIFLICGNIFLVGVGVGFITNVAQNFGLFKEELGRVVYAKDFMAKRKDIQSIWINASKIVFEEKFPEIHEDFFNKMLEYLNNRDVSYYNNYEMHISIEWIDERKGWVKVSKNIIFELMAKSNTKQSYKYLTWTTVKKGDPYECNISASVNGRELNNKNIDKGSDEDVEGKKEWVEMRLSGSKKYDIEVSEDKKYNLNSDYIIGFRAKHITNTLRVQVVHPENIDLTFVPCGTQSDFRIVKKSKNIDERVYNSVLLPKQGFIIALKSK